MDTASIAASLLPAGNKLGKVGTCVGRTARGFCEAFAEGISLFERGRHTHHYVVAHRDFAFPNSTDGEYHFKIFPDEALAHQEENGIGLSFVYPVYT